MHLPFKNTGHENSAQIPLLHLVGGEITEETSSSLEISAFVDHNQFFPFFHSFVMGPIVRQLGPFGP